MLSVIRTMKRKRRALYSLNRALLVAIRPIGKDEFLGNDIR
jgi:hypothetical protein